MPRYQNQQRIRRRLQQTPVRIEHDLVFAVVRAGGDPHRTAAGLPTGLQCRDALAEIVRHLHVELHVADHVDDGGRRAEVEEALRVLRILRGDPRQLREHRTRQPGDSSIAASGALRQPGIDQHHRNAPRHAHAHHVRPQLGFHQHQQLRPHALHEATQRPWKVVRRIAVRDAVAEQSAHLIRAGRRHRGDEHARFGQQRDQPTDQRCRRDHFAGRHRVHPNDITWNFRVGPSEPLASTTAIVGIARAAPDQQQHDEWIGQNQQCGVQRPPNH